MPQPCDATHSCPWDRQSIPVDADGHLDGGHRGQGPEDRGRPTTLSPLRPYSESRAVNPLTTSAFDLPERLAVKADPALIAADDGHFAAIAGSLEHSVAELSARLDAPRLTPEAPARRRWTGTSR